MYSKKTIVQNISGLHARPASDFVAAAKKFNSIISINSLEEDLQANAKSIVLLLSLGISKGTEVEISASGEDEKEAVDELIALIDSKFGED
ncbi:MAG TPA: HPr family phosphocarrier protein [Anaerovoracaceae bacterium]|nr:HPr family phosphocarrier protein [Anaerovoracaceae bacterium]